MTSIVDIDHQRAAWAWKKIEAVREQKEYKALVKTIPALINQNGLIAALAYLNTRSGSNSTAASQVFEHLSDWLVITDQQRGGQLKDRSNLFPELACASTQMHRQRTDELLAVLAWLRRFADVQFGGLE